MKTQNTSNPQEEESPDLFRLYNHEALNAVQLGASLVRYVSASDFDREKSIPLLNQIENSLRGYGEILTDLFLASRLVQGTESLKVDLTSFVSLIEEGISEVADLMGQRNITVVKVIHQGTFESTSDKRLVRRILFYILSHAAKILPLDSSLRIELMMRGEEIQVEISGTTENLFPKGPPAEIIKVFCRKLETQLLGGKQGQPIVLLFPIALDSSLRPES